MNNDMFGKCGMTQFVGVRRLRYNRSLYRQY